LRPCFARRGPEIEEADAALLQCLAELSQRLPHRMLIGIGFQHDAETVRATRSRHPWHR
jgi:hypothetical protein